MGDSKRHEIWHNGDYLYVRCDHDGFWPSGHEKWLRPYFDFPSGGVVMDVGAHVGSHSIWMAGKAATVLAVEPHPVSRRLLRWNLALNDIGNVSVFPFALLDGQGRASMPDHGGGSRIGVDGPHTVDFVTMDSAFATLRRLDFLKMDCEGSEAKVLRGGRQTLARLRPRMIIEAHHVYMSSAAERDAMRSETERELEEIGYIWEVLTHTQYKNAFYYDCTFGGQ